ncbi:hypothetical protein GYN24_07845 [Lactococcus piscium]|nr:hypothetical protein [Lactococcus paracarnosus]MCJ1994488.1 hypothetical protein [Lactococcus paracarnosus]
MTRKISIIGVCFGIVLLTFFFAPQIQKRIRNEEAQIVPKVTVTDQVKAVPNDDIKTLLSSQPKTTLILLNTKNIDLNKKFDTFINQHQDLGIKQPIYIFQELYHDKLVRSLDLDDGTISVVKFIGENKQSVYPITSQTQFDANLALKLKQLSEN